ncbi:Uncharacterised protein [Neisseria gonorrhoeae]|uniref:Uncharacterized protein n=1 Tax=Neisseria gonorrhoeae TaxID=485 RepID=A0A378VYX7_NEIGO|nr:Uncharacterised protein [Neisseria gonorrhoeae]
MTSLLVRMIRQHLRSSLLIVLAAFGIALLG